ncbi:MAG: inositol monophosphatase [Micavibrio aeruginosavorus]|uniref:Inositol-1-monophosphatase n=1 Tax=Micavibrio aeruginosavorus TaxID=349221 RepID=A0A7T5UGY4_9BACT|nr:MAG: inositol monophosphatase [Micavibrio aeruginosavorus]
MALSPNMNVMLRAAEKAARSLIRDFGEVEQLQVSQKGPADFVSAADHRSESILYEELSKARRDWGFLMEERGEIKGSSPYRFIIDPLDGTTNFLHGIPHWNITIAIEENEEVVAGIVYDPVRDEMFRAEKSAGAFLRNKRLRISGRRDFAQSLIATGMIAPQKPAHKNQLGQVEAIASKTGDVRRMGAAALDLSYVAAGRLEGYWEYNLKPWDIAAGMLIVKEAGGFISSIHATDNPVYNGNIVAGNGKIFDEFKKTLINASAEKDAA